MIYATMMIIHLLSGCSAVAYATEGDQVHIATAAHCIQNDVHVAEVLGNNVAIRWDKIDRINDLATGRAFAKWFPPIKASIAEPKPGPAVIIGYPANQPAVRHADLPGLRADIMGSEKDLIEIQPPIVPGTSGGAVMQDGSLVGIVTHTTPAGGACTPTKDLYVPPIPPELDFRPSQLGTRDGIFAAIGALLFRWWKARDQRLTKSTDT